MKIGISKKIVGPYGVGLSLFLFLVIYSYINLISLSLLLNENTEIADRVKLISDLQIIIQKLVMPANDYLITGDKKERETFAQLNTELSSIFANVKLSKNKTEEEKVIEKEVENNLIKLQQKAMVLLTTENPVGNKEAGRLMEEMDAFADGLTNLVENFHIIAKGELELHSMEASQINKRTLKIYIILLTISLTGVIVMTFLITMGVVRPLQKLTKAVRTIGQGNLDYRIEIKTGDEIEMLGGEFNNMTQALKLKNDEIKKYTDRLEKTNRQLDQNILQLYTLYSISKTITATFEIEKLLNQIAREVEQALKIHRTNIMLINHDKSELYIAAGLGVSESAMEIRIKLGDGIYGWAAMTGQAEVINNPSQNPRFKAIEGIDDNVSSMIITPFKGRGEVIGIINVYKLNGEYFDETSYELLAAAANQIGMTLENARLFEETKTLAITDGMTGLYNHRYFLERINEEFERTKRYKRSISIIMIDVDHFKKYNDTHGHPKGDEILKGVAKILKDTVRKSDTAARYGGEEFVIILPETGGEEALLVAEKLRGEVVAHDFPGGETQPLGRVTISVGLASFTDGLKSFDELIKNADNALYHAKEEGRNRVCT
ncbi:MAG: diguanylate cyclase [Nitrospinae bacterium]|nr:diguanylate cyclase [Nitrospinota bacterium]